MSAGWKTSGTFVQWHRTLKTGKLANHGSNGNHINYRNICNLSNLDNNSNHKINFNACNTGTTYLLNHHDKSASSGVTHNLRSYKSQSIVPINSFVKYHKGCVI